MIAQRVNGTVIGDLLGDKIQRREHTKNMETPVSKSQKRALKLMGLPATDNYQTAAKSLEAAWCRPDGIPQGCTWRTAASLTDAALIAGIKVDYESMADSKIEY